MKPQNLLSAAILALSMVACSKTPPQSTPTTAVSSSVAPAAPSSIQARPQESTAVASTPVDSTTTASPPLAGAGAPHPRFRDADVDHDGRLSRTEAQVLPYVSKHFEEIDADHDGYVTRTEMRAAHDRMQAARGTREAPSQGTPKQPDEEMH